MISFFIWPNCQVLKWTTSLVSLFTFSLSFLLPISSPDFGKEWVPFPFRFVFPFRPVGQSNAIIAPLTNTNSAVWRKIWSALETALLQIKRAPLKTCLNCFHRKWKVMCSFHSCHSSQCQRVGARFSPLNWGEWMFHRPNERRSEVRPRAINPLERMDDSGDWFLSASHS